MTTTQTTWTDARISDLTAAISRLADTDYVTASELTDKIRHLDLGILADRLGQLAAREGRHDTIRRAIDLIDTATPADLAGYLAQTSIHDHLKADPDALRDNLEKADGTAQVFGAWKASQQLLKAAGLPY